MNGTEVAGLVLAALWLGWAAGIATYRVWLAREALRYRRWETGWLRGVYRTMRDGRDANRLPEGRYGEGER